MPTVLADTFTASLAKLANDEQKQAQLTAYTLMTEPDRPGLQLHRIDKSRDPNFWSVRVSRDIRIIVHKLGASLMLVHVSHHDAAYGWAERRRCDVHPTTGAIQIVEVRELVEEIVLPPPMMTRDGDAGMGTPASTGEAAKKPPAPLLFERLGEAELMSVGVPADWIADVLAADEERFYELAAHLPGEATDALLDYATTGVLKPAPPPVADPLAHPDTLRRFRILEGLDELKAALDAPFERWAVFLHPAQRGVVARSFSGPARVAGSAGTGKTVVALHRVVQQLRRDADARVLLAGAQPRDEAAAALRTGFAAAGARDGRLLRDGCAAACGARRGTRPASGRRRRHPLNARAGGRGRRRARGDAAVPLFGMDARR